MFQLLSTIVAATLVAVAISSSVPAPASSFQVKAGFEFLGSADGKVLLRPVDALKNQNLTYQDAMITCNDAGYKIATIESEAQHKLLWPETCTDYPTYWIDGVSFQNTNNFFSTTSGQNLTYLTWAQGRPAGDVVPDYICIALVTTCSSVPHKFEMYDSRCNSLRAVACEADV